MLFALLKLGSVVVLMRYYVVADPHGFYSELVSALRDKGFFDDVTPHKLIIL